MTLLPAAPRRALLAAAAFAVMPLARPAIAQARKKITISYGGDGMQLLAIYIARGMNYFAEEGLELDWVNVNSGTNMMASVMGGSADLTPAAFFQVVQAASGGANAIATSSIYDVYSMNMVLSTAALEKTGIDPAMSIDEKARRMKGLTIGISAPGSSTDLLVRSILLTRGIDPEAAVKFQPFGLGTSILAAFERKLCDGFVYTTPIPEIVEQRKIGRVVVNPFTGEVPELNGVPYVAMVSSKETVAAKPDIIRAGIKVMARALRYARQDPDGAHKVVRQFFPDLDQSVYDAAFARYVKGVSASVLVSPAQVQKTIDWMNIWSPTKIKLSYDQVAVAEPARSVAAEIVG